MACCCSSSPTFRRQRTLAPLTCLRVSRNAGHSFKNTSWWLDFNKPPPAGPESGICRRTVPWSAGFVNRQGITKRAETTCDSTNARRRTQQPRSVARHAHSRSAGFRCLTLTRLSEAETGVVEERKILNERQTVTQALESRDAVRGKSFFLYGLALSPPRVTDKINEQ